jgi:hypothetical protein
MPNTIKTSEVLSLIQEKITLKKDLRLAKSNFDEKEVQRISKKINKVEKKLNSAPLQKI